MIIDFIDYFENLIENFLLIIKSIVFVYLLIILKVYFLKLRIYFPSFCLVFFHNLEYFLVLINL